jgi:hypothetical protein
LTLYGSFEINDSKGEYAIYYDHQNSSLDFKDTHKATFGGSQFKYPEASFTKDMVK